MPPETRQTARFSRSCAFDGETLAVASLGMLADTSSFDGATLAAVFSPRFGFIDTA
jgi:hypothetical protein